MKSIDGPLIGLGVVCVVGTIFVTVVAPYLPWLIVALTLGLLTVIILRR